MRVSFPSSWILSCAAFIASLCASVAAQGSTVFNIQPSTVTAASSGNAFDVTLTNTGLSNIDVGNFSFGLSVSDSSITFTSATTATTLAPYLFDGDSLFGPIISTTSGAQTLIASDVCMVCMGNNILSPGATVGLGRVFFDAGPQAAGVIIVTFNPTANSLADPSGVGIAVDVANNGTITVLPSTVPEPSTLALAGLAITSLVIARSRRSRPA